MTKFVNHPFWGSPTGEDHCEGSYVVTPLLAEFWGAMNSLLFVSVATFGWYKASEAQAPRSDYRFPALFIFYGVSAFFSFMSHATLQYSLERFDETIFNAVILLVVYLSFQDTMVLMFFQIHVLFTSFLTLAYPVLFHFHLVPISIALAWRTYLLLKETNMIKLGGPAFITTGFTVICWTFCIVFWILEKLHCHPQPHWAIPSFHAVCQFFGFSAVYLSIITCQWCHAHARDSDNELPVKFVWLPLPHLIADKNPPERPLTKEEQKIKNRKTLPVGDVDGVKKRHGIDVHLD